VNLSPHPVLSFTAIELAVVVAEFFSTKGRELRLKWPNDLWTEERKKCGGILVQGGQASFLAGIGLNLFSEAPEFGGIYEPPFLLEKAQLARELADYIHAHRIPDPATLRRAWVARCGHLDREVTITEGADVRAGRFAGLGDYGEALLVSAGETHKLFNGSLRLV
jgi:BirA family biotin operon repressor/biotin-[acetyl-CoA-carboxylase] ligase